MITRLLPMLILLTCNNLFGQSVSVPPGTKKEISLNESGIKAGAGKFLFENSRNGKKVVVHYYYPQKLKKNSSVIFVIPGAGRNGNTYRDAWIAHADKYNVLVLAPEYPEDKYPGFWSYNLAGMIQDVKINKERKAIESYNSNLNKEEWILNDFDQIFDTVRNYLKLKVNSYDMFGHSAGGQILHRLAIYKPESKANRILASNAGWYTVPDKESVFPYGLKNSIATEELMRKAFNSRLVVFLGERDDENETRGDLVRSAEVDIQGIHRLQRGKYFYEKAKQYAKDLDAELKWKMVIVPNVGHDYIAMGNAAAKYLYEGKSE
ncbi:hypothetical protein [Longitalea luteola]|uniref:hypothetical protein n=1 Tax=Longitalea luteola TaxID=2812563 RepID=UPI001A96CBA0|nr:hypothetical protein [Longitalea luteola]